MDVEEGLRACAARVRADAARLVSCAAAMSALDGVAWRSAAGDLFHVQAAQRAAALRVLAGRAESLAADVEALAMLVRAAEEGDHR